MNRIHFNNFTFNFLHNNKAQFNKGLKSISARVSAYAQEAFAILKLSALYFVKQTWFDPKKDDVVKDETPVLFVHGYLHNSSGWNHHKEQFRKAGRHNLFTVDLGALPTKSIEDYAEVLSKRVKHVKKVTGRNDLILIGHSMGGVVSAHYAVNQAFRDKTTVTHVITLHSPLQGTKTHWLGAGPCVRSMAYQSPYMMTLSDKIKKTADINFMHVASKADLLVKPYTSALNGASSAGAGNVLEPHLGHNAILFSNRIIDKEIDFLGFNRE